MEHAYYWVSTFLQIIIIYVLANIYEKVKKD
jgi:hypothetical protein